MNDPINPVIKIIPTPVKAIAVLYFISAALGILGSALILLLSTTLLSDILPGIEGFGVFIAVLGILMSILNYYIGKGLYKGKNWSRILVIILGALAAIGFLFSESYILMAIYALIVGYMLLNKKVKEAFGAKV